jgi:hypothetical protein
LGSEYPEHPGDQKDEETFRCFFPEVEPDEAFDEDGDENEAEIGESQSAATRDEEEAGVKGGVSFEFPKQQEGEGKAGDGGDGKEAEFKGLGQDGVVVGVKDAENAGVEQVGAVGAVDGNETENDQSQQKCESDFADHAGVIGRGFNAGAADFGE